MPTKLVRPFLLELILGTLYKCVMCVLCFSTFKYMSDLIIVKTILYVLQCRTTERSRLQVGYPWALWKETCHRWRWPGECFEIELWVVSISRCRSWFSPMLTDALATIVYRKKGCLCLERRSWSNGLHWGTTRGKGSWENFWCLLSTIESLCRQVVWLIPQFTFMTFL